MNEKNYENYIAGEELGTGFSLEDILAEYKSYSGPSPLDSESLSDKSKRIVLENIGDAVNHVELGSIEEIVEDTVSEEMLAAAARVVEEAEAEAELEVETEPEPEPEPEPVPEQEPEIIWETPKEETAAPEKPLSEFELRELVDADERDAYAEFTDADDFDLEAEEPTVILRRKQKPKGDSGEKFLSPIVALLALITHRRSRRAEADAGIPTVDDEDADVPEMEPEKAAKFYGNQLGVLRLRGRVAMGVSLVMIYITLAFHSFLPLAGAMKGTTAASLVLCIMLLTVMVCGLDVFTAGIMNLVRGRATADSLVSVACVLAVVDALVIAGMQSAEFGLPFCAIAAVSMTMSIWGAYFTCKGMRSGFRVLSSKKAAAVTAEKGIAAGGSALLKSRRGLEGFVKRSEQADIAEYVYNTLAPVLLACVLVLGVLASLLHRQANAFFHCVSTLSAVSASISAGVCFALPFAITAKKLYSSGAAVCGWAGARDIGRSCNVVVTDSDLFPQGTVEISGIRVLEGADANKVISYTGSVVSASGNGMAGAFAELITRNGYSICRVENFIPHDGGGMTAVVGGENVMVGSTGFMNLMGIRVPQKIATRNTVFTAINGSLVGIFDLDYKTIAAVQNALGELQRSKREPIFALRDFNISPVTIENKFHLPADKIIFPAFSERFRISGTEVTKESPTTAVVSRDGVPPLVEVSKRGRKLYLGVIIGTAIAAACAGIGLLLMFIACWQGNFESATAAKTLLYMLLAFVPQILIGLWLQR